MTKIQLASDLHLDQYAREGMQAPFSVLPQADLLVLAGDVDVGLQGMDFARELDVPVVYVPGVLEYSGLEPDMAALLMRFDALRVPVHVLQNSAAVINGIRFLGTTLWPNFGTPEALREPSHGFTAAMERYRRVLHNGGPLTYEALWARHQAAVDWLTVQLAEPFDGPTVVVSHHAPHPKSIPGQGAHNPFEAVNTTRLTSLMPQVDYWLHGDVHVACDYRIENCRVVCNPVGTPADHRYPYSFAQKSNGYRSDLLLDVAG
ncbi:metallophosphoesterase [Paracidovorax konjaci]|uniref:Calcineurin-like phosphoesterase n=1 Tax=Paracidovorax konjaci TaxID=32040 RepID=A0A1I1XKZ8_9BURK|nr:metallophosphoesterase [Paracidovorax konjaci]SFE07308.1 Calcineurin-like phosphoesterase [Paracidovorax konjaci]